MTKQVGKVYLVGAGPGDVTYLTLRAIQLLAQADVLVYDALVEPELLQLVPSRCVLFNVGKRGGKPSTPQPEIDRLLVEHCQQGKQVVRLKSGDPFIFGRSSSEIQALIAAECPFEVVPGISSALAAPLLAGIPLTDPVLSRCFTVLSAHDPEALDWQVLAQLETLAILMGGKHLAAIAHQLQRHGKSSQTPVAVIRWAGHPQQQIWTGTLATIVRQTAGEPLSPIVIVVGEVVGLRNYLQVSTQIRNDPLPFTPLSEMPNRAVLPTTNLDSGLKGKTVLVTRSAEQSSQLSTQLQQEGATVIEMPALEIGPPSSWDELDNAIAHLQTFDWVIFTSTNGVDYFFERLLAQDQDARALAGVKIAVVGKKTATRLRQRGLQPDFVPPDFVADSLVAHFPEGDRLQAKKILFPRVESGGREVLVRQFTRQGAEVVEVAAYQSLCPATVPPEALDALQDGTVDVITFASSKTVKNFWQLLGEGRTKGGESPTEQLSHVCIASIGPQTSQTCRELLGRVDVEAEEYTLEGLTQAIARWAAGSRGL